MNSSIGCVRMVVNFIMKFIVSNYDAREGLSENNPYQIEIERDEIMGRN